MNEVLQKQILAVYVIYVLMIYGDTKCVEKTTVFNNETILVDSTKAQRLDKSNSSILDAVLDSGKPYCARAVKDFFVQINFSNFSTIKRLVVQGGAVNGRGLLLYAFTLQFSYDGVKWFSFFEVPLDSPKYFLVSIRASNDPNKKIAFEFSKPAFGMHMRLIPRWPQSNQDHEFCLRLQVSSCVGVPVPFISTVENHYASPSIPVSIMCHSKGQVGLKLWWEDFNKTVKFTNQLSPNNRLQTEISTNLTAPVTLNGISMFKCSDATDTSVTCTKVYTCKAMYQMTTSIWMNTTTVHVKIKFPDDIAQLTVLEKNTTGVSLRWEEPKLNDLTKEPLEYILNCVNKIQTQTWNIPFGLTSWFVPTALKYEPHACNIRLRLNNSSNQTFSFRINQRNATINYHSYSLRPLMKPDLEVVETTSGSIKIDVKASFSNPEFGLLKQYYLKIEMKKYAERTPELYPNLPSTLQIINLKSHLPYLNSYLITVKPWSEYNISVTVINNDGLSSNTSSVIVTTKQGVPADGPTVKILAHSSTTITFQLEEVEHILQNGKILDYKCFISTKSGNITSRTLKTRSPQPPFTLTGLRPFTHYQIRCKAKTAIGFGPLGKRTNVTTDEEIPGKPKSISVLPAKDTSNLLLRWSPPDPTNGNITQYEVHIILVNKTKVVKFTKPDGYKIFNVQIPASAVNHVKIRAYTIKGYGDWKTVQVTSQTTVPPPQDKNDNIVIILTFSIAIMVLLALVVLCFVYYKRRFSRRYTNSHHVILKDMQMGFIREQLPSETTFPDDVADEDFLLGNEAQLRDRTESLDTAEQSLIDNTHEPFTVHQFAEYVNEMKQDENERLLDEFKGHLMSGKCYSWQVAVRPENKAKNRYTNIAAYDHSRIILHHDSKRKVPDYINANSLKGYKFGDNDFTGFRYISTQGPLENTLGDFWLMVWQENIDIIVMVTNLKENDKLKCAQYWPTYGIVKYGGISVNLQKIDKTADIITRTFVIEKTTTKEQRTILQFHFVSWPDHGVPDYPTSILSLRRRVRHYMEDNKPILVHCSAGVGRSGCFVLIDAMLEQIDNDGTVDIFNYLKYLRSRRINMVQTFEQYVFAHTAILEYITFGNTEIVVDDLDKKTRELIRGNGMKEEFTILKRNTQPDHTDSNQFKVLLREGKFVNAYRVDGYKHRDAFILMKAPAEESCADFWKMVLEKQVHTIVMLNKCQESVEEYFKYWPEVDADCVYRDMTISMNSEVASGNIITRKIKVTTNKQRCEVHHFQYVDWPDTDVPNRRAYSNLCTLMQAVEKSQQNLGNGPIVVHAGNDYGRSGTFIAIYNSVERLKVEQLIDVLQCVRAIRIAQPKAVDNVAQYQFIYNMLRTYLEGFENYWNYKDYKVCRSPLGSTTSADGPR